jgi:PAS domain-containing protein
MRHNPPGRQPSPTPPPGRQNAVPHPEHVKGWLMPNGSVLSVDQAFMDYTGWTVQELVGKPFSSLAVDPGEIEGCEGGGR